MDSQEILTRFFKSMNNRSEQDKRIHVSSFCYDCLRRTYYSMTHENQYFNLKTLVTFWLGRMVHLTPILKENEVPLNWEGIVGTCDEYQDGVLLEKKTCRKIPMQPQLQHIKQAEYYSVLLRKAGKPVREAHVVYIDTANLEVKALKIKMRDETTIEKEMLEKKNLLELALKNEQPPDRFISWLCDYCPWANICFGNDQRKVKEFVDK